tara:strand:+ start:371 stop:526 length:156 start_codon:yes stop_codon:yes gene_type:complete
VNKFHYRLNNKAPLYRVNNLALATFNNILKLVRYLNGGFAKKFVDLSFQYL